MMFYNPENHSKEYLLSNPSFLYSLAELCPDFASSVMASDFDILSFNNWDTISTRSNVMEMSNNAGRKFSVAHLLALHQTKWLKNPSSKDIKVLSLQTNEGYTVAHMLAEHQHSWGLSPEAKRIDILRLCKRYKLTDDYKENEANKLTVAHLLAKHNDEWIAQLTIDDLPLLSISAIDVDPSETVIKWIYDNDKLNRIPSELFQNKQFLMIPLWDGEPLIFTTLIAADEKSYAIEWAKSPMAQNLEIISHILPNENTPAHFLAKSKKSNWHATAAASNPEVFELTNKLGTSVGHELIRTHGNNAPAVLWGKQFSSKVYNGTIFKNYTIAHALAAHSSDWCRNSPDAFSKEVLASVCYTRRKTSMTWQPSSLVEMMVSLPIEERALRLIGKGAGLKMNSIIESTTAQKIDITTAERLYDCLLLKLYEETEPLIKTKIMLAAYSTFRHFENLEKIHFADEPVHTSVSIQEQEFRNDCWDRVSKKCIVLITQQIAKFPHLLENLHLLTDLNMEPSDDLLLQLVNERIFGSVLDGSSTSVDEQTTTPLMF
jgi:hypothetical protein